MDDKDVQPEEVSVETALTEATPEPTPEPEPLPQPLTEERMLQILSERDELMERKLQGTKDKAVSEARREAESRARLAEGKLGAYETSFATLDEDTRKEVELARLRGESALYKQRDKEEATRTQQDAFSKELEGSLTSHLEALGIDPTDKRIDWANDAGDYLSGRGRFDASVAKILKADKTKTDKDLEDRLTQGAEERHRKDRAELGLDSIPTGTPPGGGSEREKRLAQFTADPSSISLDEAEKLLNQ